MCICTVQCSLLVHTEITQQGHSAWWKPKPKHLSDNLPILRFLHPKSEPTIQIESWRRDILQAAPHTSCASRKFAAEQKNKGLSLLSKKMPFHSVAVNHGWCQPTYLETWWGKPARFRECHDSDVCFNSGPWTFSPGRLVWIRHREIFCVTNHLKFEIDPQAFFFLSLKKKNLANMNTMK